MASSSSIIPITPIQRKYDVFISFRGRHIRDNFLSHLRSALFGEKIVSFAEDNIRRGDDISKSLRRTIKESQISIIIFSKKYPSSRWCLGELEKIMKCNKKNGQFVIPVFLKVKPTDVENQTGCFGQALAQYEGHPKIQIWRAAFTKAANLAGWDSEVTRWCLDELVRIMECRKENGQIVIPVFYKVDPSHVRKQSGPFGQALAQYEGHPRIHKWRDALTETANLSGWDLRVTGHEATLIESIVADALGKLSDTSSSRNYSKAYTQDRK
ncbi:putative disease resistance protein At4g11170 isoform X2 [Tripterygium wilfordii]|uniref:putative disease resistance protein At4g11170 isoform X2 n=1 Tax=Tripterygium wilfordii TaxID=458696 RepID=UPI0018F82D7B|nr:putative disease resistance protein At4g11170 isoform X2 [Tripterygium wilfordii]